jgi:hypothetical protein
MSKTASSVRRTTALLVALLLLLAGCVGTPLGPDADTEAPTDTSVNVTAATDAGPTDSTDDTVRNRSTFVAGLSSGDPVATDRLLAEHREAVVTAGIAFRQNVTGRSEDTDVPPVSITRRGRVVSDEPVVRQQYESTGGASSDGRSETWRNATVSLQRFGDGRFSVRDANATVPVTATLGAETVEFLRHGEFVVNRTTDDRVFLSATGTTDTASESAGTDPKLSDYRGSVVLDRRGFVRTVALRFSLTRDGTETQWRVRHETTQIGSVAVERPSWWRSALDSRATFAVTTGEDYVRLTNDDGETYDAGTTVRLSESAGGGTLATLDDPLKPGESIFVFRRGGLTKVSRDRPADDRASLTGTYYVVVLNSEYREVFRTDVSL